MNPFQAHRSWLRMVILCITFLAMTLAGCSDNRVAGTSSGVDNPQITVAFHDSTGKALNVTGDLNIYARDQNPALDPQPLWTIKLNGSPTAKLTGDDILRINTAGATKRAAGKVSAASAAADANLDSDSTLAFNLQLKTEIKTGSFAFGLSYDASTKSFARGSGDTLSRLDMQPKPLVRYEAKVSLAGPSGQLSRVFIPGTPFKTTLVESTFVFEDLPEGTFNVRLLDGLGRVYAMAESLDTRDSNISFTPSADPISILDSTKITKSDSGLGIVAGPDRTVLLNDPSILEATLINADAANPKLSVLWRRIDLASDSTAGIDSIQNPTSLKTQVIFGSIGVHTFEVTATLGLYFQKDTVLLIVKVAPQKPVLLQPVSGDSLIVGRAAKIQWLMPVKGSVTVLLSTKGGTDGSWVALTQKYPSASDVTNTFTWTPTADLGGNMDCLLQVRLDLDTTITAQSAGPFSILK